MAMSEAHKRVLREALGYRAKGLGIKKSIAAARKDLYHPHQSRSVSTKFGGAVVSKLARP